MKVLVGITDGVPGHDLLALEPGSVVAAMGTPITRDFDTRLPPIGMADLVVEGTEVYVELEVLPWMVGLYPALGGVADLANRKDGHTRILQFKVSELSLCVCENADPRIRPIVASVDGKR